MIYSWGTDTVAKQVDSQTVALCRFRYVGFAFIFNFVWQRKWFLQGRDRALDREVGPDEIELAYGPGSVPSPGIWRRFSAVMAVGAVLVAMAVSASVEALFPGDGEPSGIAAGGVAAVDREADDQQRPGDEAADTDTETGGDTDPGGSIEPDGDTEPGGDTGPVAVAALEAGSSETAADGGQADSSASSSSSSSGDGDGDGAGKDPGAETTPTRSADQTSTGREPSTASVDGVATVLEMVSDDNVMTVDLSNPAGELAVVTVDHVYSTAQVRYNAGLGYAHRSGNVAAQPGSKLVVVDLQLLTLTQYGSYSDGTFRLLDETGRLYGPYDDVRIGTNSGKLLNEHLLFEVPADLLSFTFQAGVPDGQQAGEQAAWRVSLAPGDVSGFRPTTALIEEGPAEVVRTSDSEIGSLSTEDPEELGSFQVLGAEVAADTGGAVPDPGFQWIVVEVQAVSQYRYGRIRDEGFRLQADGEWYPPLVQINQQAGLGDVVIMQLPFEVPIGVDSATLEIGNPVDWPGGGQRATWQLTLP
jgi:hypothetical protein